MAQQRRTAGAGLKSESERDDSGYVNVGQIIAATAAATTGALVANLLGIHGTLGGVALFSLISSLGTVLYTKSMWHTQQKLRAAARSVSYAQRQRSRGITTALASDADPDRVASFQPRGWNTARLKPFALTAVVVFTLSLGTLSGIAALSAQDSQGPADTVDQPQAVSTVAAADSDIEAPQVNEAKAVTPSGSNHADAAPADGIDASGTSFDKNAPATEPRTAGITEPRDPPLPSTQ